MSEDENTPTKIKVGESDMLAAQRPSLLRSTTPTPAPKHGSHDTSLLAPEAAPSQKSALKAPSLQHMHTAPTPARQSLPHFKPVKRINHRQSAPAPILDQDEDLFDKRFIALEPLGKGAFSQVIKAKSRETDKVYAIKKARGVFEGVKDRYVQDGM
jgi:mitosis inhibitor protein kinase SWE1